METTLPKFVFNKGIYSETGEIGVSNSYLNLKLITNGLERMTILSSNRYVGVNTTNPQYHLDMKGIIRATDIKVQSIDNFPDYVFEESYILPELSELSKFIDQNGHLPDIPPAKEVKENGVSMVVVQTKLLEKLEGYTIYIIKLEKLTK